jgi:hypothetical protein
MWPSAHRFMTTFPADRGAALLFLGSGTGLSQPAWHAEGDQPGARFGVAVAGAGDVNGDGYSDVVVGAAGEGKAYLFLGSSTGLDPLPVWTGVGQPDSNYGVTVNSAVT